MMKDFVRVSTADSVNVIKLTLPEILDSEEFDLLNTSILEAIDDKSDGKWILDLTSVDYMGSSILGLLINFRQHIKGAGGKLVVCGLSPRLAKIFHTCCLEKLFTITPDRPEAMRAIGVK